MKQRTAKNNRSRKAVAPADVPTPRNVAPTFGRRPVQQLDLPHKPKRPSVQKESSALSLIRRLLKR